MNREPGYYFVKQTEDSKWEVAEWYESKWYFIYPDYWHASDSELFAIHAERLKEPNYQP